MRSSAGCFRSNLASELDGPAALQAIVFYGIALVDSQSAPRLVAGQREAEVERKVAVIGGDVGELPAHPLLVGRQPLHRRPRKTEQRHVAVAQVNERAVEPVAQAGAARAGAERVVGAEHDVVGEQLRAPVEELAQGLLAILGVELVLLVDPDPGQIATRSRDLLVSLRLLGLELRELVPGHLPFLAGSDLVFRHLISLQSDSALPHEPDPSSDRRYRSARTHHAAGLVGRRRSFRSSRYSLTTSKRRSQR